MDKRRSRPPGNSKKIKSRKKTELNFDESDRQSYLKGLHERKQQRRQRASEQLNRELKTEMKRIKEKKKKQMIDMMNEMRQAADTVQSTEEEPDDESTIKYELDEQTVEIKPIDDLAQTSRIEIHHRIDDGHRQTKHNKLPPKFKKRRPQIKQSQRTTNRKKLR